MVCVSYFRGNELVQGARTRHFILQLHGRAHGQSSQKLHRVDEFVLIQDEDSEGKVEGECVWMSASCVSACVRE